MKKGILFLLLGASMAISQPSYSALFEKGSPTLFADLLIWKLTEVGNENWAQELTPPATQQTVNMLNVPFDWRAGYRVGLDFDLGYDAWDLQFTYTHYDTNQSSSASVNSGGIYASYIANFLVNDITGSSLQGVHYGQAAIQWQFKYNTVDVELGRVFTIDSVLTLRPYIGVKTAFIDQKIYTQWNDPIDVTNFTVGQNNLKQDFWGVGPTIGFNSYWPLWSVKHNCLKLIGTVSTSLLWGHWNFAEHYTNDAPASISPNEKNIISAESMSRGLLGVEFAGAISDIPYKIRLGYEAQVWLHQMQIYSFNMGRLDNLMSLQGGVLEFCFNG